MESALRDFHRTYRFQVSPYQAHVGLQDKTKIINNFRFNISAAWTLPIALTIAEIACFKKPNVINIALAKYISYVLAFAYSTTELNRTLEKLNYINIKYHKAPQVQVELLRNAEIYRALKNNI